MAKIESVHPVILKTAKALGDAGKLHRWPESDGKVAEVAAIISAHTHFNELLSFAVLVRSGLKRGHIKSKPLLQCTPDAEEWPMQTLEEIADSLLGHVDEVSKPDKVAEVAAITEENINGALASVLKRIIDDLPVRRDWLDPELEVAARRLLLAVKQAPARQD